MLGGDRVADRGAVSWCMDLPPGADIPSARGRRYRWEQWERRGWWECSKGKLVIGESGCLCGVEPPDRSGDLLVESIVCLCGRRALGEVM